MRILVVEDEQKVANALREGLEGERYDVAVERTGEGAFFRLTTEAFDLILLDLGLPGRDGVEILTALRQKGIKTPVLVLTARDTLDDRGVDDALLDALHTLIEEIAQCHVRPLHADEGMEVGAAEVGVERGGRNAQGVVHRRAHEACACRRRRRGGGTAPAHEESGIGHTAVRDRDLDDRHVAAVGRAGFACCVGVREPTGTDGSAEVPHRLSRVRGHAPTLAR